MQKQWKVDLEEHDSIWHAIGFETSLGLILNLNQITNFQISMFDILAGDLGSRFGFD